MTKPYHLTQEQVLEILNAIPSNLSPEIRATKFANAALDKVLGEPVAWVSHDNVAGHICIRANLAKEGIDLPNDTKLYAPKVLT